MTEIVTLAETCDWLRVEPGTDDATIAMLIAAATEAALATADAVDTVDPIPARLKLAVLTHVARAYDGREDGAAPPDGNARLLMPLRTLNV